MTVGLFANPGQTVILAVQVLDNDGYRVDGYVPTLDFVKDPSGSLFSGLPSAMTRDSSGLYNLGISIPSGITSIGTYLASISWTHPTTSATQYELFLINVALPFGAINVTPA